MKLDIMPIATEKQILEVEKAARDIWIEYYRHIFPQDQIEYMLKIYHSQEAIRKQIQNGTIYMVIMIKSEIVGYMCYYIEDDILYLPRLCIKKEYRKKGLATQLIERIETVFLSSENELTYVKKMQRNLSVRNTLAIEIYEHLGFRKKKRVTVNLGNGYFSEDYVMERRIRPHDENHLRTHEEARQRPLEERHHGEQTETIHPFIADTH